MPIKDIYRHLALSKTEEFFQKAQEKLKDTLSQFEEEDLEFGFGFDLQDEELFDLWKKSIEENNYMEVSSVEVMEHHDGAYLKATFKNSKGSFTAERYVSIRSSGRVEISHAFFFEVEGVLVRMEIEPDGRFRVFVKSKWRVF